MYLVPISIRIICTWVMECTKYYIMHVSASTFSHRGKSLPRILLPTVEYLYTRVPLFTTTVKTFSITGIGKIRLDTRPDGLILLYTCRYIMRVHAAWVRVERVRIILCVKKKKKNRIYIPRISKRARPAVVIVSVINLSGYKTVFVSRSTHAISLCPPLHTIRRRHSFF